MQTLTTSSGVENDNDRVENLAKILPALNRSHSDAELPAIVKACKSKALDALIPDLLRWLEAERVATKQINPLEAKPSSHMTMAKILEQWADLRSCGEKRTYRT